MKFRFITAVLVLIISLGFISCASARILIELGVHTGGDDTTLVDDSDVVIESTKAGGLYSLALGGTIDFTDNIEAQLSFGIKSDGKSSSDSNASWVRYPLNSMLFYRSENFRLGLGVTAHLSPKHKVSGAINNASNTYKDAIGSLVEIDYKINEVVFLGMRYTNIEYVRKDDGRRIDGSSIGLLLLLLL